MRFLDSLTSTIVIRAACAVIFVSIVSNGNDMLSSSHRYKYSYQVDAFSYTLPVQVLSRRRRGQEPQKRRSNKLFSTKTPVPSSKNIAIVGGGLAGLSTAYHLLSKSIDYNLNLPSITIFDKTKPGQGGASSVAGG